MKPTISVAARTSRYIITSLLGRYDEIVQSGAQFVFSATDVKPCDGGPHAQGVLSALYNLHLISLAPAYCCANHRTSIFYSIDARQLEILRQLFENGSPVNF